MPQNTRLDRFYGCNLYIRRSHEQDKTLKSTMNMTRFCSASIAAKLTHSLKKIPNRNPRILLCSPFSSTSSTVTTATYPLSSSSSLILRKGDITQWFVDGVSDAIVNSTNIDMLGGGEVDEAIRRAAGPEFQAACCDVPKVCSIVRCPTGEARITRAFNLPVSHVIHTAAPSCDADFDPDSLLRTTYRNCLKLAKENNIQHIAFPAICCGVFGFIYRDAARISISMVKEFANEFKEVHFVMFRDITYSAWQKMAEKLL